MVIVSLKSTSFVGLHMERLGYGKGYCVGSFREVKWNHLMSYFLMCYEVIIMVYDVSIITKLTGWL